MDRNNILTSILSQVEINARMDCDVSGYTYEISRRLGELLSMCDLQEGETDEYTKTLVEYWIVFNDFDVGGSNSDYCASIAVKAMDGYVISIYDEHKDEIISELHRRIEESALNPNYMKRELAEAGIY